VLDLLLGLNITASLLILLVSMQIKRPLDFAVFPSLILIATLFRLALNVSSTRWCSPTATPARSSRRSATS
jgi:flagellar biosynthesis protein FlhA